MKHPGQTTSGAGWAGSVTHIRASGNECYIILTFGRRGIFGRDCGDGLFVHVVKEGDPHYDSADWNIGALLSVELAKLPKSALSNQPDGDRFPIEKEKLAVLTLAPRHAASSRQGASGIHLVLGACVGQETVQA